MRVYNPQICETLMISFSYIHRAGHLVMRGYQGDEIQAICPRTLRALETFQGLQEDQAKLYTEVQNYLFVVANFKGGIQVFDIDQDYKYLYYIDDVKYAQAILSVRKGDAFIISSQGAMLEVFGMGPGSKMISKSKFAIGQSNKQKHIYAQALCQMVSDFGNPNAPEENKS